jgi:hypothetical protein
MHAFVLQDWTTIRGGTSVTQINQSESEWQALDGYQDLIAWIDIREVTIGTGATYIQFNLQTAPMKDEILFANMELTPLTVSAALSTPSIRKVILANSGTYNVPLGKWVRWQLSTFGTPSAVWDATFRILLCANPLGGGGGGSGSPFGRMR